MNIIVIGATGATGKDLVELLLSDKEVSKVDIFVRKETGLKNEKLNTHIIDFEKPDQWRHLVKADVICSCLGTTLKDAGSKEAQWRVDYDYQYWFAKAARDNGVESLVLVSSGYASVKSPFFYTKMKGKLEEDVKRLDFPRLIILNPPILLRKNSNRKAEVIASKAIKMLNKIGLFRSGRPMPTELVAKAMLKTIKSFKNGVYSIKGQDIRKYAKN